MALPTPATGYAGSGNGGGSGGTQPDAYCQRRDRPARPPSVRKLDAVLAAPRPQRLLLGLRLERIPPIEDTPVAQKVLEAGIRALARKYAPHVVGLVRQEFSGGREH